MFSASRDSVDITVEENSSVFVATSAFGSAFGLGNPNALVATSKGMQAVKLYTNKIFQLLTGVAG